MTNIYNNTNVITGVILRHKPEFSPKCAWAEQLLTETGRFGVGTVSCSPCGAGGDPGPGLRCPALTFQETSVGPCRGQRAEGGRRGHGEASVRSQESKRALERGRKTAAHVGAARTNPGDSLDGDHGGVVQVPGQACGWRERRWGWSWPC